MAVRGGSAIIEEASRGFVGARDALVAFVGWICISSAMGATPDPGLLLLPDSIEPSMRDIYGNAWYLKVPLFLGLWLLAAEMLVRMLSSISGQNKAVISGAAGAGMAIGSSYQPSGSSSRGGASSAILGLLIFGIFMLALFLLSKRLFAYPLAILLFMSSYATASERTQYQMSVEEAKNTPERILPLDKLSLSTRPALVGTSDEPSTLVAIRVHNGSPHDLVRVEALCSFYLKNGEVAHEDKLTFPLDYRVPSGFGARIEASRSAPRQFERTDYANRVSCEIHAGHLRTAELATGDGSGELEVLAVDVNEKSIRVRNDSQRGISSLSVKCLANAITGSGNSTRSLGRDYVGWIEYADLRREFKREGEPMIRPNSEEIIVFAERSEIYSGDSKHRLRLSTSNFRCDIDSVRWN